jgi:large subunit ribosomal protein L15
MRLNDIRDQDGATKAKKRLGRGIGSGLGKTAGRGTKGQKARAGVAIKGFEGGQMPLHRRLPKRGFNNIFAKKFNELNLGRIQEAVDSGRLDAKNLITVDVLKEAGLIRRPKDGVRLLGNGELKTKLAFEVTGASGSALKAIEAAGGTVTLKSITGRDSPAADAIKRKRRGEKREALAAKTKGQPGKAPKAADGKAGEPEAKPAKAAKAKAEPAAEAEAATAKPPKKEKAAEAEDKKPKAKPEAGKKDKS